MTGPELKERRKAMKQTQAEFASFLGVSQEMVSMMEDGTKMIPQEVADKLLGTPGGLYQNASTNATQAK